MATIFPDPTNVAIKSFKRDSVRVPITWPHRIALIISGNITVGSITGTETFNVEFSGGGPVTINTLSAPYANLGALQSSFQSQIDFALGAGVGILINLNDQRIGFLDTDYYNGFVTISNMSDGYFATLPIPNNFRDASFGLYSSIVPQIEVPPTFAILLIPLDGISNMIPIPDGYNSASLWYQIESNSTTADLVLFGIGYTNGVEGLVTDGYSSELISEVITVAEVSGGMVAATPSSSVFGYSKQTGRFSTSSGFPGELNGGVVPLKAIPDGAIGMYVIPFLASGTTPNPPTFSAAITFGIR